MTVRAAIYARLSRDHTGAGESVATQLADARALASARGWTLAAEFVDGNVSAATEGKRPEFANLLAAVNRGEVDAIIGRTWDRMARNRRDDLAFIEACEKHKVHIAFTRGADIDLSTVPGQMVADVLSMMARAEIREKGERQTRANRRRAEAGRPPSGVRLTGYETDGTVRGAEARIVRLMFDEFAAGTSLRGICLQLQARGETTRHGQPWNPSTVRTILTNPRYAGQQIYQGAPLEVEATWQPIVDADLFGHVQALLADPRRRTQRSTVRKHLGSGLYRCGVCGSPVSSWSAGRYRCPHVCVNRSQGLVDRFVVELVEARLGVAELDQLLSTTDPAEARLLAGEMRRLTGRLTTIGNDYDTGLIDGHRYREAREKTLAELDQVQQRQARLAPRRPSVLDAPDPVQAFRDGTLTERRRTIAHLAEVNLYPAPRGRKTFDENTVQVSWRT